MASPSSSADFGGGGGRGGSSCNGSESPEDDDDLFEIDLDVVDNLPPPLYWESCSTATDCALLANCLLPISDVSSAVPVQSITSPTSNIIMMIGTLPDELLKFPVPVVKGFVRFSGVDHDTGGPDSRRWSFEHDDHGKASARCSSVYDSARWSFEQYDCTKESKTEHSSSDSSRWSFEHVPGKDHGQQQIDFSRRSSFEDVHFKDTTRHSPRVRPKRQFPTTSPSWHRNLIHDQTKDGG
uniref:Uncharacterized protein n=1 Tax=Nelumbo nucifera TaxID=4432 RepID=A0A822ZRL3_NELNU|nr:TPA_asm: hypothetical protein HUJ06_018511 [Nelumbo nucifera]